MREKNSINRRTFIKTSALTVAGLPLLKYAGNIISGEAKTRIVLVKTEDRVEGIKKALDLLDFKKPSGMPVLIKPNFNTSDPPPGSTHNDTLAQIVREMKARGASRVTVGEWSGPEPTPEVLKKKGIHELAAKDGFDVIDYSQLPDSEWFHFKRDDLHWPDGFHVSKYIHEAEYITSICCLKTHGYGGVFTMSLKLSVGTLQKPEMHSLHRTEDMRKRIAEINLAYKPNLIVMDGMEAFIDGGPMKGTLAYPKVIVAGTDRVAVDSVGLAVLKENNCKKEILDRRIFDQEQIARAAELGIGVKSTEMIELVGADDRSKEYCARLEPILKLG